MRQKQVKIGAVVSSLHEPCQSLMWKGLCEAASFKNIELITFVATSQDRVDSLDMHFGVIRDFMINSGVDAAVIFSGAIIDFANKSFLIDFCNKVSKIPLVSLNHALEGVPSIVPDNTSGIFDLVNHFIIHHGYNKIAFIKGPKGHDEADARYEAYKKALTHNALPYDENLVFEGSFSAKAGVKAIRELFATGVRADAILCADDEIALGAISELKKRGLHVPTDIGVAGFDDIVDASLVLPSLSTIKQPLFQMGEKALETAWNILNGYEVEPVVVMPTKPVFRRSCGCFPSSIKESSAPPCDKDSAIKERQSMILSLANKISLILQTPIDIKDSNCILGKVLLNIIDSFEKNLTSPESNSFLNALDTYLFRTEGYSGDIDSIQAILSTLSHYLGLFTKDHSQLTSGSSLLQQAQVLVREHKLRVSQTKSIEESTFQLKIRETAQKIITTFDQNRLRFTIKEAFPAININKFVFALYDSKQALSTELWSFPYNSKLVIGFDAKEKIFVEDKTDSSFVSSELVPPELMHFHSPGTLIFMPLFFKSEQFGYIIFGYEENQPVFMYEELRLHIGSALKSSFMMHELKIQSMVDELTGLYNRRGFVTLGKKMIEAALTAGGKLLVFYADLDGLKLVNDKYGHDEGDIAIKGAANVLTETFRNKDVIGRIGGDEFTVILHLADNQDPEQRIMDRLKQKINDFNKFSKRPFTLSISIGSSVFDPDSDKSFDDILREADKRMMNKKRNRFATRQEAN